jgi:hypothetical protein
MSSIAWANEDRYIAFNHPSIRLDIRHYGAEWCARASDSCNFPCDPDLDTDTFPFIYSDATGGDSDGNFSG